MITNNADTLNRMNSQPSFINMNKNNNNNNNGSINMSRPVSSYPLKQSTPFVSFKTTRDQSVKKL